MAIKKKNKNLGIGKVVFEAILSGKTDSETYAIVKEKFPNGDTKLSNIPWYRGKLRRDHRKDPKKNPNVPTNLQVMKERRLRGAKKSKPIRKEMQRQARINRITSESNVEVEINLSGTGKFKVDTGIGFFNHMLEQFSRHSLVDLNVKAVGDLEIDHHHTVEDVGIVLGQAVGQALGDKTGIRRFAEMHVAMDESLTRCVIDVSGRPFLVWQVEFQNSKIGDFDTELIQEFFRAFSFNAGITLHVANLYGSNCHHVAESCFKALAVCLRMAVETDPRLPSAIPSTKGKLGS